MTASAITFDVEAAERKTWVGLVGGMPRSSLEQSWAFAEAIAAERGHEIWRAVVCQGDAAIGVVLAVVRRLPFGFRLVRVLRGPLWSGDPPPPETQSEVYRALRAKWRPHRRGFLFVTPELMDNAKAQSILRAAGFRRTVTGYSTIWLDLSRTEEALRAGLDGKWRNALSAAERTTLKIDFSRDGSSLDWLMAQHDAFRRDRRFSASPGRFLKTVHDGLPETNRLVVRALQGKDPVAGALFLRHGTCATYEVGWAGDKGRETNAMNRILWEGMLALKSDGVGALDLGGVDGMRASGVARFKLGLGGELTTLCGTWM